MSKSNLLASSRHNAVSVDERQRATVKVVQLRDISLASYLDRREIVRSSEGYKLGLASNQWWGESLGTMLSRVIVVGLSERLPASTIYSEGGAISADPNAVVAVNVQRLDVDQTGALQLLAQAAVEFNRPKRSVARTFRIVKPPAERASMPSRLGFSTKPRP